METNVKQLRCGQCGEYKHELYLRESGEVVAECVKCKSTSLITVTKPEIKIKHNTGDGTLCVF